MFVKDSEVLAHALLMWINYIETGDVVMSRNDAIESQKFKSIKSLTDEQMKFVLRLKALRENQMFGSE